MLSINEDLSIDLWSGSEFYSLCLIFFHLLCTFQINLRLILVSGKTKEFLFSPSDSAGEIAKIVFEQWPDGKHARSTDKNSR